ncbi:MAG: hypothetical protein ACOCPM_06155, partial [Bacteroidales bacterium]
MKTKSFLAIVAAVLFSISAGAQNYETGDMNTNLDISLISSFTGETELPPTTVSFEIGVAENIALGVFGGISTSTESNAFSNGKSYRWEHDNIFYGLRGMYYFYSNTGIDLYGGASAGNNSVTSEFFTDDDLREKDNPTDAGGFIYRAFAGGRYYFSEPFGIYAEAGLGIINLNLGVTAKF